MPFETAKVGDIIEIVNHFICTKEMVDTIMEPRSADLIKRHRYCVTHGTYADSKHRIGIGEYQKDPHKRGIATIQINRRLDNLIRAYEEKI